MIIKTMQKWFVVLAAATPMLCTSVSAKADPFEYDKYAAVLKKHVNDKGRVDYRALKANRGALDEFLASVAAVDPKALAKWSDKEQIAFWVNAYNALTLQAIIDAYPIKASGVSSLLYPDNSIRQISGVWEGSKHTVAGQQITLSEIEHKKLRGSFNEPGIHMALVCASIGCPFLRTEPYTGEKLDRQLGDQTRRFLADPEKFRIDYAAGKVLLSPIFKWFGEDFVKSFATDEGFRGHGKERRAALNYISQHVDDRTARFLQRQRYEIGFLDYDWSLNEQ